MRIEQGPSPRYARGGSSAVGSGLFTHSGNTAGDECLKLPTRPCDHNPVFMLSAPHASVNLHCGKICLAKKAGARRTTLVFLPRGSAYAAEAPEAPPTLNTPAKLGSSPLFASFTHPAAHTRLSELPKTLSRLDTAARHSSEQPAKSPLRKPFGTRPWAWSTTLTKTHDMRSHQGDTRTVCHEGLLVQAVSVVTHILPSGLSPTHTIHDHPGKCS